MNLFKILFNRKGAMDVIDGNSPPNYNRLEEFERGTFGRIYKVKMESGELRALKKIWFSDQDRLKEIFREVQIMSQLKGPAIVKFYSAWMEDNEFIYILMELCQDNMRRLIDHKPVVFAREKGAPINRTEYFISWHLLKELIEAVNYLHSCTPKIIHRDLKPANVLVTDGQGGSFIKLCDFGLSKTHEHSSHTTHQGTKRYMAPEVRIGRQYNEKSDVFSLCVMALELFGFVFKDFKDLKQWKEWFDKQPGNIYVGTSLANNFSVLIKIIFECINIEPKDYSTRPSCQELLNKMNSFAIDNGTITRGDLANDFYNNFLRCKLI